MNAEQAEETTTEAPEVMQAENEPPRYSIKSGVFEPEALPFRIEITLPAADIAAQETWWWGEVKAHLPPPANRKGKKKEPRTALECAEQYGGRLKFFLPLYQQILKQQTSVQIWPQEPMVLEDLTFNEDTEGGTVTLSARVFLWPHTTFSKDPWTVDVTLPKAPDEEAFKAAVDAEILKIREAYQIESEKLTLTGTRVEIEEGDIGVISILPKIEGELWRAGVISNHKLPIAQGKLHPDELRQKLLGLTVGNHRVSYALTERNGALAGKVVDADVMVHSILRVELPAIDDELAHKCGKETVEVLLSDVTAGIRQKLQNEWEKAAGNAILPKLLEVARLGPIPASWRALQAEKRYEALLGQVGGKEGVLLKKLKVPSKAEALSRFEQQAIGESMYFILMYGYALHMKIKREGEDLSVGAFVRSALLHLISMVVEHQNPSRGRVIGVEDVSGLVPDAHSSDRS